MAPRRDLVPERFQRASGPIALRKVIAEGGRDGVAEIRERASEELAAGLELRPQAEEAERVVAGDIHAVADLIEERVQGPAALEREPLQPRRHQLRGALVHPSDYGERGVASVNVRYMVDDVEAAVAFYTTHLGFTLNSNAAPAFADVTRGELRLLLSGATSSAGRAMPDGRRPESGGWNRFQIVVEDIASEAARLREAGVKFRNEIIRGPGGSQVLVEDPSGNVIEIFQPR